MLVGLLLAAFFFTFVAGRHFGPWGARLGVLCSSLPLVWGVYQYRFIRYRPIDPQVTGRQLGESILLATLLISFASMLGLFLAGRRRPKPEVGTGLNP